MKDSLMKILNIFKSKKIMLIIMQGKNLDGEAITENCGIYRLNNNIEILFKGRYLPEITFPSSEKNNDLFIDDLEKVCLNQNITIDSFINILIHEFGHFLSAKNGSLNQDKMDEYSRMAMDPLSFPKEKREEFLEEETRAWNLGHDFFKSKINIPFSFKETRDQELEGYKNGLIL